MAAPTRATKPATSMVVCRPVMNAAWLPAVIASASFADDPLGTGANPCDTTAPWWSRRSVNAAGTPRVVSAGFEGGGHGGRQDGAADRRPEDATELDRGRLDAAGDAGLVLGNVPDDGIRGGCHDQPDAEAQQDERGPEMDVRGVHLEGDEGEDGQRRRPAGRR